VNGDLQLLDLEAKTLWVTDGSGRLLRERREDIHRVPHLVIARVRESQFALTGAHLPPSVSHAARAMVARETGPFAPDCEPACLAECAHMLETVLGPVVRRAGPSYLVADAEPKATDRRVWTSATGPPMRVKAPPGWEDVEWGALLDGGLGPWALSIEQARVVALCHSSRLTDRAAEAGVWTDPAFRGRGYAAAVTAAWGSLFDPRTTLFYSTGSENRSSQRVAQRLGLRSIGWMWTLTPPDWS